MSARRGLFAEAHGGTLFFDEVADMPLALQGKLMRVLESGEIRPVGGEASRRVDVHCTASTNADLAARVRAKLFREELFFRLDVVPVAVPPLRERRHDIGARLPMNGPASSLASTPWPAREDEIVALLDREALLTGPVAWDEIERAARFLSVAPTFAVVRRPGLVVAVPVAACRAVKTAVRLMLRILTVKGAGMA